MEKVYLTSTSGILMEKRVFDLNITFPFPFKCIFLANHEHPSVAYCRGNTFSL